MFAVCGGGGGGVCGVVLAVWSTGVLEYLFGPSEVWRRRDAHFRKGGGAQ
jgi:hypothetical protein